MASSLRARDSRENDVVISGLSGSFPKADNVSEFAEKLFAKDNLLQEVPHMPCKLGKLRNLDKFDAEFFGFNQPHRVNVMDPMARMVLEKAYEALLDSGTNPVTLKGKSCGVFIGIHFLETEALVYEKIQKGASLAISRSFNANRISYWLDIHGPSFVVDSACSSTLVALEMAYKAISSGECESALVGGCHLCLHPALLLHLLKVGALNPKSESRVFDADAGGFCKAEAVGMFYLQKAKNAKRIYAEVLNVRSNHDGSKPLFLSPHGPSQEKLLKMMYGESKIDTDSVAWIEAHATGTLVGDKQEVTAIDAVFKSRRTPLLIGSVKSNMGHAEAAAGVSSLSKVIIAMETGFIPPNINISTLRADIDAFSSGRIKVVTERTPWSGGIVGVSGFGMGGANSHAILKSFTKEKVNRGTPDDFLPRIVCVSGRTREAVEFLLNNLEVSSIDVEFIGLLHQIHNDHIPLHSYRGYTILHENKAHRLKKIKHYDERPRKIVFTYTNYVNDWSNIYRSLNELPVFRKSIECCAKILKDKCYLQLLEILDNSVAEKSLFRGFMAAVTMQIALTHLMKSLHIWPDYIVGYSIGEIVCAYADNCLTLEETLIAAYHCAVFLSKKLENTHDRTTFIIDKQFADLRNIIPPYLNFSFPSFVNGSEDNVALFLNVIVKDLNCSIQTNTTLSDVKRPLISDTHVLREILQQEIQVKLKSNKWIGLFKDRTTDASVYFINALTHYPSPTVLSSKIPHDSIAVEFLGTRFFNSLTDLGGESVRIALTDEGHTVNVSNVLSALGELYLGGKNAHYDRLYPEINYPVSRGTKMIAPLIKWKHTASWPVAFSSFHERMLSGERKVSISLDEKEYSYLTGHEIDSENLFPGSGYLFLAWETLALIHGKMYTDLSVVFENVRYHRAVKLSKSEPSTFNVMVRKGNGDFEILEKNKMVASGRIYVLTNSKPEKIDITEAATEEVILNGLDFYRFVLIGGYNYKGAFRSVQQVNSQGTKARVMFNGNWITYLDGISQLNMLNDELVGMTVPVEMERMTIDVNKHRKIVSETPTKAENGGTELDVWRDKELNIIESAGVQIKGYVFQALPSKPSSRSPLVQKYLFTTFASNQEKYPAKQIVYLYLHVLMDFYGQQNNPKMKIAEIIDEDSFSSMLFISSIIANFVKEQPIFQAEQKAYFCNDADFKITATDVVNVFGRLPLGESVHLIVCTHVFKGDKLKKISKSLCDNGFLIARQTSNEVVNVPSNWCVCCNLVSSDTKDRYLLLKKKPDLDRYKFKTICVSSSTFEWIKDLQEALKVEEYQRVILYAEREPFNGILGFYNCLRLERDTEHVRCIFLLDDTNSFNLESDFCRAQLAKDLPVSIYKDGEWGCYVRQPVGAPQPINTYHTFLNTVQGYEAHGPTLAWSRGPMNLTLQPEDKNLMHVYYATVNRSDALVYQNRIAREVIVKDPLKNDYVFGMEFAGRNSSGIRYMGLLPNGCLSSFVQLEKEDILVNEIPNNWSMEDAATVPLAYYVAIYALVMCGRIEQNCSVLIHSASTVIGQAAINIANHYGCKIFVTVNCADEKNFIEENHPHIPKAHICSPSDTSFEYVIRKTTSNRGVNIVLNAAVDNKLEATINCLAQNAKLIQIKKTDLSGCSLNAGKLLVKHVSLHSALLGDIFSLDSIEKRRLKDFLDQHIQENAVKPLARLAYNHSQIQTVFNDILSHKQESKYVICIKPEEEMRQVKPKFVEREARPRFTCAPDRSYVVCGGLGGMGLELVDWLVCRGARKIVVTSRQGLRLGSQTLRVNRWKAMGVQFHLSHANIANDAETVSLLEEANQLGPVGGIFNLAAVLKDKMFKNQTAENFETCAAPKLHGTFNLDRVSKLLCPHLEQFVVFSSIACGYGNLGQTNYGMFNSTVERICEQRREANLPALAIQWGAVGNVGMFVSMMDGNVDKPYAGVHMQPMKSCLQVLDECLCLQCPIVTSLMIADKPKLDS